MTDALLTPFDFSEPVKAGRKKFWKQILPVTSIDYEGRKIDFDQEFHKDLQLAHQEGAFDQVPVVFADANNKHNMDPRNFGGEVLDLQYRGKNQGTWALIEADRDAAKAIQKNPKLGVSARILQGVNKADGRTFKRAVNHVLLTMNPRVSGMEPWQAVNLSEEEDADIEVVDLTAAHYEEGNPMGKTATAKPKATSDGKIDLSKLSDEQFQSLLDLATAATVDEDEDEDEDEDLDEEEVEDENEIEDTTTTPPPKTRRKKSKTKITVEKDSEDDGEGDDEDDEDEEEEVDETDLSTSVTVRSMQVDLAEQRWNTDREDYAREGVPPFLLDLAEPVLSRPEAVTIDLSGTETVDASDTIRKMLDGVKGMVDLTPEIGHQVDLADTTDEDAKFLDEWDKLYG